MEKNKNGAQFGYSVALAGDVNGDWYDDVIVGARYFSNGQSREGAVFVYHGGSAGLPASENWMAESNQAYAYFGWSVASEDLDRDGYSDVIVGSPYYDYAATQNGGGVFVWYGGSSGLGSNGTPSNAGWSAFNLTNDGALSGWSVTGGDNIEYIYHPGLVIGSPGQSTGGKTSNGGITVWTD